MIKTIIFDIGNVLVDFNWKKYLKSFSYDDATNEVLLKTMFLSPTWLELDRGVLSNEELLTAFTKDFPEYYHEIKAVFDSLGKCIHHFDYAVPLIQSLKRANLNVYFLSNYGEHMYNQTLDELSSLQYTDGGILSYREKLIKPDPRIYRLLLERYHIEPTESVFLDDTLVNVEAAMALDINGILFTSYEKALEELAGLGVIIDLS